MASKGLFCGLLFLYTLIIGTSGKYSDICIVYVRNESQMTKMHHHGQFDAFICLLTLLTSDEYLFNVYFVFAFLIFAQNHFYCKVNLI